MAGNQVNRPSLSVCVPVRGASAAQLATCLRSATIAMDDRDRLTVVIDGDEQTDLISVVEAVAPRSDVIVRAESTGLVDAWNHCLDAADRELVHIMHSDDVVAPDFYEQARQAFEGVPTIVAFAAARAKDERDFPPGSAPVEVLEGAALARRLLSREKPAAGSFVYRRSAIVRAGRFTREFPYCPDEEYCLRLASFGPMAFHQDVLYVESAHPRQHRFQTWLRDDFVDIYVGARRRGVGHFDNAIQELADRYTTRNVITVAVQLIALGKSPAARHHLRRLAIIQPGARRTIRYALARILGSVRGSAIAIAAWRWIRRIPIALPPRRGARRQTRP